MDPIRAIQRVIEQAESAAKEFKEQGDKEAEKSAQDRLAAYRDVLRILIASQEKP